jgi:hypothetical protein
MPRGDSGFARSAAVAAVRDAGGQHEIFNEIHCTVPALERER